MPPIRLVFSAPLTVAGHIVRAGLALTVILALALGRPSAQPLSEALLFALILLPLPIWLALRWLGDRGRIPWLFRRPLPSVTLGDQTLELCLPDEGCRTFDLDAIGELRPRPGFRPALLWSAPDGELVDRDGHVLMLVPSAVAAPIGARGARMGLASLLIKHGGDRFTGVARRRWLDGTRWPVRAS
jgi:hypothetical protein